MLTKLNSRKLLVFIGLVLLVVSNYFVGFGLPSEDVLYLTILGVSYILGQGFVDAKKQPTNEFPVEGFTNSVTTIIQAELGKLDFGKNIPMEKIIEELTPVIKKTLGY